MADAPAAAPPGKTQTAKPPAQKQKFHAYPFWSPRFWHGMRFGDWMRLCIEHRFRIHPIRWPMAFLISLITPFNSVMGRIQRWRYGTQIDATPIDPPPVFILGHWRSGTTYLHELLYLDDRFVTPTTYQCFAPLHFLLTEWWMVRLGGWLLPRHRPMDNVLAGWDRPQEDEFALIELDSPTPYFRMAFPNDPPPHMELLDMEGVAPDDLARLMDSVSADPKQTVVVDLVQRRVVYRGGSLAAQIPEGARGQLLDGSWNATAVLLDAGERIEQTAARLGY